NAPVSGAMGEVNLLSNGTLQIGQVNGGATTTTLMNFNGGALKATIANVNYLTGANLTGMFTYGGGGTFDNDGVAITIGAPFLAPTGSGVSSIALTDNGANYIG